MNTFSGVLGFSLLTLQDLTQALKKEKIGEKVIGKEREVLNLPASECAREKRYDLRGPWAELSFAICAGAVLGAVGWWFCGGCPP